MDKTMDARFKTLEQENTWRLRLLETDLHEFWPELGRKLVNTRKPHECSYCGGEIPAGTLMRCDTGSVPSDGLISLYTCMDCIEEVWCEEVADGLA